MTALQLALALALAAGNEPQIGPAPGATPAHAATPAPAPAAAAAAPADPAGPTALVPYLPGETMSLDISLGFLKAGESRIWVGQRAGALLPVFLQSQSAGLASIITLKTQLVSNLDTATGLPRSSRLEGVEPSYRHVDTAAFDREANVATVREVGRFDNTYKIEVPPGTLDFVALVFRLRSIPLPDGAAPEFQVLSGRTVSRVVATVEGRESVETPAGTFAAIRVRVPTGLTGKISEKSPTYLWLSDDARRIVVRISADFSIGRANALLTSYTPGKEAR